MAVEAQPLWPIAMSLFERQTATHPSGYRRSPAVTIRWATPDDAPALEILAVVDSASVPAAPQLLAFVGDELWAAFSPATGAAVSDPFRPSAEVVDLLRERGRQLTVPEPSRPRLRVLWLLGGAWRRRLGRLLTQPW
jgi:hypothetical protein